MPDYMKGKVILYVIRSYQTEHVYIGSTIERLSARMGKHRAEYKKYKAGKRGYITSFEVLKFSNAYIGLLEKHPCICREELERCEGKHIRSEPNAVNKCIPGRTDKEYYRDNIEKIKADMKEYYQENIDRIKARKKEFYQENTDKINTKHDCPCGGRYTQANRTRHIKTKRHQAHLLL